MSEEQRMDILVYGSKMVSWSPLGKLLFVLSLLIVNICTDSLFVPIVTLAIGIAMLFYSTACKIPKLILLAFSGAILIIVVGVIMVLITGNDGNYVIWDSHLLWLHICVTDTSFNKAWLVFLRSIAGIALMIFFATSTPIPHLSQGLSQIHIPNEITELVTLIYRYAFLFLERMEVMWNAAQCRMGFNGFMNTMRTTATIAVGMFITSFYMVNKTQIALKCRNYHGVFPVYNTPAKMSIKWIFTSIAIFIATLVLGYYTSNAINMAEIFFGEKI